jgi:hypothetical protein
MGVLPLKESEKQPQILRLTTPKLHPKEQKALFGNPEKRLKPRSLRMTRTDKQRISETNTRCKFSIRICGGDGMSEIAPTAFCVDLVAFRCLLKKRRNPEGSRRFSV